MFKKVLENKKYPTDDEVIKAFSEMTYSGGERISKIKFILQAIEDSYSHKEFINNENLTIEHIMPQTLTDHWKASLGSEWEYIHSLYQHNIGNLTLTAYNSELSNKDFEDKKNMFANSHLELNKYVTKIYKWDVEEISKRNQALCKQALSVWSYFGDKNKQSLILENLTNTKPSYLYMFGQRIKVDNWCDVLVTTLNNLYEISPQDFYNIILENLKKIYNNR